jgi:hypothetical protein
VRRLLASLVLVPLVMAGCGDDGPEVRADGAGSSATEAASAPSDPAPEPASSDEPVAATVESPCVDLDVVVLDQVEDPGPADDRPEGAPPTPEEVAQGEDAVAALERLAAEGPEELRADAADLADLFATALADPDAVTDEQEDALVAARQRLFDWGVEHCDVAGPIWSCPARGTFRLVGAPLDGPPTPVGGAAPDDVVGGVDVEPGWRMVEVARTEDRATFAWLDADGLAVRSQTAVTVDGGWTSEQTTECDPFDGPPEGSDADGEAFDDEGFAPVPPGSSTSVP